MDDGYPVEIGSPGIACTATTGIASGISSGRKTCEYPILLSLSSL